MYIKTYFAMSQPTFNKKTGDNMMCCTPAEVLVLDFLLTLISSSVLTPQL